MKAQYIIIFLLLAACGAIQVHAAEGDAFSITNRPKVLVLPFEDTTLGKDQAGLGKATEEMVITALMKRTNNIHVLTQKTLTGLLNARKITLAEDLLKPNMQKLEGLGLIDAYVYGAVSKISGQGVEVDLRLVDAKTTEVISVKDLRAATLDRNLIELKVAEIIDDYLEPFCGKLVINIRETDTRAKLYIKPAVRRNAVGELVETEFFSFRIFSRQQTADEQTPQVLTNAVFEARPLKGEEDQSAGEERTVRNLLQGKYDIRLVKGEGYEDVEREVEILRNQSHYVDLVDFKIEYGNLIIENLIDSSVIIIRGTSPWNYEEMIKVRADGTVEYSKTDSIAVEKKGSSLSLNNARSGQYGIYVYKQFESFPGTVNLSSYSFAKIATVSKDRDKKVAIEKGKDTGKQTLVLYLNPFLPEDARVNLRVNGRFIGDFSQTGEVQIRDINPGYHQIVLEVYEKAENSQLKKRVDFRPEIKKGETLHMWINLIADPVVIDQKAVVQEVFSQPAPAPVVAHKRAPEPAPAPTPAYDGALPPEDVALVVGASVGLLVLLILLITI